MLRQTLALGDRDREIALARRFTTGVVASNSAEIPSDEVFAGHSRDFVSDRLRSARVELTNIAIGTDDVRRKVCQFCTPMRARSLEQRVRVQARALPNDLPTWNKRRGRFTRFA